jgi:hypothetical protein
MIRGRKRYVQAKYELVRTAYCDFCRKPVAGGSYYSANETRVSLVEGDVYPEQDCREVFDIDVCPACFRAKIVPAVEALGVKFRKRAIDDYQYVDSMEDGSEEEST